MTFLAANLRDEIGEFEQAQSQYLPSPRRVQGAVLGTYRSSLPRNVTALKMPKGCSSSRRQPAGVRLARAG